MTDAAMDLVVVSYHSDADLAKFVQSYEDSKPTDIETRLMIYLVEATGSEIASAASLSPYDLRWERDNVGYNYACNDAADIFATEYTPSPVIAFFNADTELRPGVIEGCYRHLLADDRVAIVGPPQVNRAGKLTHAGILGTHARPQLRGWQQPDRGQYRDVVDCVSVSGSAYFIKTSVFEELGMCPTFRAIDPAANGGAFLTTHGYWGETFVSYHADAHGWLVRYVGDVPPMIHEWHQASPQGGPHERHLESDRKKFRDACRRHGIPYD